MLMLTLTPTLTQTLILTLILTLPWIKSQMIDLALTLSPEISSQEQLPLKQMLDHQDGNFQY